MCFDPLFLILYIYTTQSLPILSAHIADSRHSLSAPFALALSNCTITNPYPRSRHFTPSLPSFARLSSPSPPLQPPFPPQQDTRYLKPFVVEIEAEQAERKQWDSATKA